MKILLQMIVLTFICLSCFRVSAQSLTEKDFKLLLDGKDFYSDSSISVGELLKLKEVTANFSWLSIKDLTIFIDFRTDDEREHMYDGTAWVRCNGNMICDEVRKKIKGLRPTNVVVIMADNATNKSGAKINIPNLVLHIK